MFFKRYGFKRRRTGYKRRGTYRRKYSGSKRRYFRKKRIYKKKKFLRHAKRAAYVTAEKKALTTLYGELVPITVPFTVATQAYVVGDAIPQGTNQQSRIGDTIGVTSFRLFGNFYPRNYNGTVYSQVPGWIHGGIFGYNAANGTNIYQAGSMIRTNVGTDDAVDWNSSWAWLKVMMFSIKVDHNVQMTNLANEYGYSNVFEIAPNMTYGSGCEFYYRDQFLRPNLIPWNQRTGKGRSMRLVKSKVFWTRPGQGQVTDTSGAVPTKPVNPAFANLNMINGDMNPGANGSKGGRIGRVNFYYKWKKPYTMKYANSDTTGATWTRKVYFIQTVTNFTPLIISGGGTTEELKMVEHFKTRTRFKDI